MCSGPFSVFAIQDVDEPLGLNAPRKRSPHAGPNSPPGYVSHDAGVVTSAQDSIRSTIRWPINPATPSIFDSVTPWTQPDDRPDASLATQPSYEPWTQLAASGINSTLPIQRQPITAAGKVAVDRGHTFLTPEVKHLLRNYSEEVLPIFSPLDNAKSAWQLCHFPASLQGSIELEIIGNTAAARKALLYAVLTVSARQLTNLQSNEGWGEIATYYGGEAYSLLENCIRESSSLIERNEITYNEILAAIMSMVTIDVLSSYTRTTEIHLRACGALIEKRHHLQPIELASQVTDSIHINWLYIRTIQEASETFCKRDPVANGPDPAAADEIDSRRFSDGEELAALIAQKSSQAPFEWQSMEMIYGLPAELILLVRKVTLRIRMNHLERIGGAVSNLEALDTHELEESILEWPVKKTLDKLDSAPVSKGSREVMKFYTQAFHTATILYFCWKVRKMDWRHLQGYVRDVVTSLEGVLAAKKTHGLKTGHLPWPAFVAGALARDEEVRNRTLSWFDMVSGEGIGTSKLAKISLLHAWDQLDDRASRGAFDLSAYHLCLT